MLAHIDADAFFASVLIRKHPHLRGKAVLALGMGGGCVIAASYEAKAQGVKTGMPLKDALRLVPQAVRLPSDFRETGLASGQIEAILRDYCPFLEQYSVDEWLLDLSATVGGVPADCHAWGERVRSDILKRTSLSVSVGIGPSKLLAKMASEYRKPGGVAALAPLPLSGGRAGGGSIPIESFLRDRPVEAIPGIGRKRALKAEAYDWQTAWDFSRANPALVRQLFGRPGTDLQRELLGELLSGVCADPGPPKSVSRARSFPATKDASTLWAHVLRHLEYVVLKMRRHELGCRGISVWLRDDGYHYRSDHTSLPRVMDTVEDLRPYAERCFRSLLERNKGCTQAGLALWRLSPSAVQYSLFTDPEKLNEREDLQATTDQIHRRFGRNALTRGSALKVKTGTQKQFHLPIINE